MVFTFDQINVVTYLLCVDLFFSVVLLTTNWRFQALSCVCVGVSLCGNGMGLKGQWGSVGVMAGSHYPVC